MPFSLSGSTTSRPGSRPPSPTRQNSRPAQLSNITVPPRSSISSAGADDPLSDYFAQSATTPSTAYAPSVSSTPGLSSGYNTPALTPGYGDMWGSGAVTPGGSHLHQPVEIILDNEHLVMRGQGGDMNPAYLSGRVELNLQESTNIKEINMSLHGKAKVHFSEGTR